MAANNSCSERLIALIHMSHSLNSLKGGYIGITYGIITGVFKGDSSGLGYSSYERGLKKSVTTCVFAVRTHCLVFGRARPRKAPQPLSLACVA